MKKHVFLSVLLFLSITLPVIAAKTDNIIETKDYFPLNIPHSYTETQNDSQWHTAFLGPQIIDKRQVYVTTTTISSQDSAEKLADKSLYTYNDAGDVLKVGAGYTNWLNKWYPEPDVFLKGKMKIGTCYLVKNEEVDGVLTTMYLTLKRHYMMKLENCTKECILVQKDVDVIKNEDFGKKMFVYIEWHFYAKGIGLIEHSGDCYNAQCTCFAPKDGKIVLTELGNDNYTDVK